MKKFKLVTNKITKLIKRNRKTRLVFATLIALIIILPIYYSLTSNKVSAWWDSNWYYRKAIPITNSGSEQTDVYATLTLDTSDSTKFQADCGDLRFTKTSGQLLPYYIVSGCSTANTIVHVNFDLYPSGTFTIYEYYGNPSADNGFSATDFSNPASNVSVGEFGTEEKSPAPVAYWSFDEGQGTTAHDETPNGSDAFLGAGLTSPTWKLESECISGKCLYFNGNNFLDVTTNQSKFSFTNNFSLCSWIKPSASGTIFSKSNSNGTAGYKLDLDSSRHLRFTTLSVKDYTTTWTASLNQWYYVCSVMDSSNATTLYVNGNQIEKISGSAPAATSNDDLLMGKYLASYFSGFIDEPKIYNYARTADQIKTDYNAGLSGMGKAKNGFSVAMGAVSDKWMTEGLVGHWKMDEAGWSGTSADVIDSSGNGNNGTASGGATTAGGKFGNGGSFDGTDDYVLIGTPPSLNLAVNMSVGAWVKTSANNVSYSESTIAGNYGQYFLSMGNYSYDVPRVTAYVRVGTNWQVLKGRTALNDNLWHYIMFTYDGSYMKVYKDGVLDADPRPTNGTLTNPGIFVLGAYDSSHVTNANIDDIRVYNRALSSSEVAKLYEWAPGPVGEWKMDEMTGTIAYDTSGNGNNASFAATPTWTKGKYGGALSFNGTNNYLNIANTAPFNLANFTLEMWWNGKTLGNSDPNCYAGPFNNRIANKNGFQFTNDTCSSSNFIPHLVIWNGTSEVLNIKSAVSYSLPFNDWKHFVWTYDGSTVKLFVNGQVVSTSASSTNNYPRIGVYIGYGYGNANGAIDQVRVFNYARTQKQILEDMGNRDASGQLAAPVAYYNFDEGYGGTVHNAGIGGTAMNASLAAAPAAPAWTNDGKFGKALSFDGSDDVVRAMAITGLSYSLSHSGSAWIYPTTTDANYHTIFNNTVTSLDRIGMSVYGREVRVGIYDGASYIFKKSGAVTANRWSHVLYTFDGANLRLWINGVEQSGANSPGIGHIVALTIGLSATNQFPFSGIIDEMKFYNYVLTADDIRNDLNRGTSLQMGSAGTDSNGNPLTGASAEYCVPGNTTDTCRGPVGEWKMDEKSGATAYDTSGNGKDASLGTGAISPAWTTGKFGSGLSFNGSTNYLDLGNNFNIDYNTAFSFSFWVNPADFNEFRTFISKRDGNYVGYWFGYHKAANKIIFDLKNTYSTNDRSLFWNPPPTNIWTFVTLTSDGVNAAGVKLYYNGIVQSPSVNFDTLTSTTLNPIETNIGCDTYDGGTQFFNGKMDQFRIYDYVRTPAQIAWDYNKGKPVAEWRMNECQGTTIHDESGNGNNGTLTLGASGQTSAGTCSSSGTTAWYAGRSGKYGASLNFDGSDDYVDVPLANWTGDYTESAWIKTSTINKEMVIMTHNSRADNGGTNKLLTIYSNGKVGIDDYYPASGNLAGNLSVNDGQWHHIVAVRSGTTRYIYIDGKLDVSQMNAEVFAGSTPTYLSIGIDKRQTQLNNPFAGQIDDVKIFNYALTSTQVTNLYNNGSGVSFGN